MLNLYHLRFRSAIVVCMKWSKSRLSTFFLCCCWGVVLESYPMKAYWVSLCRSIILYYSMSSIWVSYEMHSR